MLQAARDGKTVVRLKGGDPFVFGRGEEETDFLSTHGIPWEVVPGLSSCTAAPSTAMLPLTSRGIGRSFAVVTARCANGAVNTSYPRADTLVVLMSVAVLEEVVKNLRRSGWDANTPAALVSRSTLPWERRAHGKLSDIDRLAREEGLGAPAVLVVGKGASRKSTDSRRPRILFTGQDPSNFRILGDLLHWPALQVISDKEGYRTLPQVIARFRKKDFDWLIFTSRLGVRSFFTALAEHHLDTRVFTQARILAAGSGTSFELSRQGILADVVAREPGSRGILEALQRERDVRILLVQGSHAPPGLELELNRRGDEVARLALHRVIPHPELGRPLPEHDIIYFASPSGVSAYWETYGKDAFRQEVWCIGDVTLAHVKRLGIKGKEVNPNVSTNKNATRPENGRT
jgi:uroporphyrinogen III methyltransferase/synthase